MTVPVQNYPVVLTVMAFVALMPVLFAVLSYRRERHDSYGFILRDVVMLGGALIAYLLCTAAVLFFLAGASGR